MYFHSVISSGAAILQYLRIPFSDNPWASNPWLAWERDRDFPGGTGSALVNSAREFLLASGTLVPEIGEIELWSDIAAVLRKAESIVDWLLTSGSVQLSMVWYVVDQLVFAFDNNGGNRYRVYRAETQSDVERESAQLHPAVQAMKEVVCHSLRTAFLHPLLKVERPIFYSMLCKATLLDPRTKDFCFFQSVGLSKDPNTIMTRSQIAEEMYVTAVSSVLQEMVKELSEFVQRDDHVPSILALWNVLRSVKYPESRTHQGGGGIHIGSSNSGISHQEDNIEALQKFMTSESGAGGGLTHLHGMPGNGVDQEEAMALLYPPQSGAGNVTANPAFSIAVGTVLNNNTGNNRKRKSGSIFSRDQSLPMDVESVQQRQKRIEEKCQDELNLYLQAPPPCPLHDFMTFDPLEWWSKNCEVYPILSQLARRYSAIRTNSVNLNKLQEVFHKLHSRERGMLSPGLVDAVVFLFVNGFLSNSTPEDAFNTGNADLSANQLSDMLATVNKAMVGTAPIDTSGTSGTAQGPEASSVVPPSGIANTVIAGMPNIVSQSV